MAPCLVPRPEPARAARARPRRLAGALPWLLIGVAAASGAARAQAQAPAAAEPAERELLNSERIEATFGSYGVDVLESDAQLRVSNLYSGAGDSRVCRTFAVVRYPDVVDPAFAGAHAAILAGGSIGATFVADGWTVVKTHRYFGSLPAGERVERLMGGVGGADLAVHVYSLAIERGGERFEYAGIAEVHHPDFLTLADLRRIYAGGMTWPTPAGAETAEMLAVTAQRMQGR